jgi:hypothetical protein
MAFQPIRLFGRRMIVLSVGNWPPLDQVADWQDPAHHFEALYSLSAKGMSLEKKYRLVPHLQTAKKLPSFGYVVPGSKLEAHRTAGLGLLGSMLRPKTARLLRGERELVDHVMKTAGKGSSGGACGTNSVNPVLLT